MSDKIRFKVGDQLLSYEPPVTPLQIIEDTDPELTNGDNPLVGIAINQRMFSLRHPLKRGGRVNFIRYKDRYGDEYYRRGLTLVLVLACDRLFEKRQLEIGHSIEHGYYYQLSDENPVDREVLQQIEEHMHEIIEANLPIEVEVVEHARALKIFREREEDDKIRLLETWSEELVELHKLGGHYDLAYFPAPANTGLLKHFELRPYTPGFILRFPLGDNHKNVPEPKDQPKLFQIYQETRDWAKILEVDDVGALNKVIEEDEITEFIKISEALHERKIIRIADKIHRNLKNINLVTIAGPSSSGKTTFAKRLSIQLRVQGIKPVRISTDDYFVNRKDTPRDEDGNYNFEALEAIDLELFNQHLTELSQGKEVEVPQFSFETGQRKEKTIQLKLTEDQLLIVEGIHGLNPELTRAVDRHRKHLIYVSALTQLVIDNHNRISTSDSRLIRRIVRDVLFRNISATTNIHRWTNVRRGEREYIFPYQEDADSMFNSSLLYELAVLKPYIKSALKSVDDCDSGHRTAHRIRRFINLFQKVDSKEIPPTSILREFIGGSSFSY